MSTESQPREEAQQIAREAASFTIVPGRSSDEHFLLVDGYLVAKIRTSNKCVLDLIAAAPETAAEHDKLREQVRKLLAASHQQIAREAFLSASERATQDALSEQLRRIADILESITDKDKGTLRMVDVERGNVYKTHLGGKLLGESPPTT